MGLRQADLAVMRNDGRPQFTPEAAFDLILGMDLLRQQRVVLSYPALTLAFA